jgi:hypothetical protein
MINQTVSERRIVAAERPDRNDATRTGLSTNGKRKFIRRRRNHPSSPAEEKRDRRKAQQITRIKSVENQWEFAN